MIKPGLKEVFNMGSAIFSSSNADCKYGFKRKQDELMGSMAMQRHTSGAAGIARPCRTADSRIYCAEVSAAFSSMCSLTIH